MSFPSPKSASRLLLAGLCVAVTLAACADAPTTPPSMPAAIQRSSAAVRPRHAHDALEQRARDVLRVIEQSTGIPTAEEQRSLDAAALLASLGESTAESPASSCIVHVVGEAGCDPAADMLTHAEEESTIQYVDAIGQWVRAVLPPVQHLPPVIVQETASQPVTPAWVNTYVGGGLTGPGSGLGSAGGSTSIPYQPAADTSGYLPGKRYRGLRVPVACDVEHNEWVLASAAFSLAYANTVANILNPANRLRSIVAPAARDLGLASATLRIASQQLTRCIAQNTPTR